MPLFPPPRPLTRWSTRSSLMVGVSTGIEPPGAILVWVLLAGQIAQADEFLISALGALSLGLALLSVTAGTSVFVGGRGRFLHAPDLLRWNRARAGRPDGVGVVGRGGSWRVELEVGGESIPLMERRRRDAAEAFAQRLAGRLGCPVRGVEAAEGATVPDRGAVAGPEARPVAAQDLVAAAGLEPWPAPPPRGVRVQQLAAGQAIRLPAAMAPPVRMGLPGWLWVGLWAAVLASMHQLPSWPETAMATANTLLALLGALVLGHTRGPVWLLATPTALIVSRPRWPRRWALRVEAGDILAVDGTDSVRLVTTTGDVPLGPANGADPEHAEWVRAWLRHHLALDAGPPKRP